MLKILKMDLMIHLRMYNYEIKKKLQSFTFTTFDNLFEMQADSYTY